jgi:iron(III) transport system ATP-binding protein
MTDALQCLNVTKVFERTVALFGVNLNVRAGQLLTLLGPSGCGKTTTLRLIAGFEFPESGQIAINGRVVADDKTRVAPEARRVGMVFQEYALFPHLDVAANVAFGLNGREKQARVNEMLALVGMSEYGKRMPHELSGGQQQRVALARALAPQPEVLLLDEPFSNLDAALRQQVRSDVRGILRRAGISCIFVTHDQHEALSISDEVAIMLRGQIAQVATPQTLYNAPASREIASFVGEANFLRGAADGRSVRCVLGDLPLTAEAHGQVDVLLRPEMLHLTPAVEGNARVQWVEFYGHDQRIGIALDDGTALAARAAAEQVWTQGARVEVHVASAVHVFPL